MITQKITLTEKGLNAGPLYDIYYSTDCTNYILTGAQTSLPNVGSTANVVVADDTVCIKLINLSPDCTENEVIIDYRVTTTTTAGPTTTTTTTIAPTTTTTTAASITTTTYAPGTFARVLATACQNSQDSNYFLVPVSPTPALNSVYKDNSGTCYTITGIPTGTGTTVGTLTYVGTAGSCNNAACVTTTTTIAPVCNTWTVTNPFGAGYYFKYAYCGQSNFLYPEVPANSSVSVCVQNNQIYDAFNTGMTFTSGSTCFATTSTTTIAKQFTRVVAHACQDFYDFGTYGVDKAVTPNPQIDQVFKDAYGTCYYITSIPTASGPIVGELTFVGGAGACTSSACVTTTTTEAPFCNQWKVDNPTGAGYYFKYQYCGDSPFFLYPEVPAYGSVTVCTQNNRIYNSFGAPLSFTNLSSACFATTTTTTTIPPQTIFTAAPCQNIFDFRVYSANAGPEVVLGAVFKDENGTCYEILSFNGQVPVGRLTYVGPPGDCTSPSCVTTTTTAAPYCNLWKVENLTGAGYYFKYKYCGQTTFTYPEVPAYSSITVCTQNDEISNPFNSPLVFDNLSGSCLGTTTTTTTIGPKVIFTAYPCQNISNFNVFQADSASYAVNDVFIDGSGTCYTLLNFNGEVPVGNLTFVGTSGSCSSPACVTTTTTEAPFCNLWQVTNPFGAAYTFRYKYCGATTFSFPEVAPNSSVIVCVQNNQISNPFGAPLNFDDLTVACNATTTTTTTTLAPTTTTTTTIAPYCSFWTASNAFGAAYNIRYKYCGSTENTFVEVPANSSIYLCVQTADISNLGNPIVLTESSSSCAATTTTTSTTTTTTLAPGCWVYNVSNTGGGSANLRYVFCENNFTTSVSIPAGGSGSFCVDNGKIESNYFYMNIVRTNDTCITGSTTTTTTSTTTTTTIAPTTTTTTIGLQKVVFEDCDTGGLDINTPITLAVNGAPLSNGQIAYIADGFGGYNCFTITNSNWTGSTIYYADLTSVYATCEDCTGGPITTTTTSTTTTTAGPTTTTTAAPGPTWCYFYTLTGRFVQRTWWQVVGCDNIVYDYFVAKDGQVTNICVLGGTTPYIVNGFGTATLTGICQYGPSTTTTSTSTTTTTASGTTTTTTAGPTTTTTTTAAPAGLTVQYLIVAGGGGGGTANAENYDACGGGAGGYLSGSAFLTPTGSSYAITVGGGGNGSLIGGTIGTNGGNSTFNGLTAIGGGRGGTLGNATAERGQTGGSGGGTAYLFSPAGSGTSGQGFGGSIGLGSPSYGGSGGGAGGAASNRFAGFGKLWIDGVKYAKAGWGANAYDNEGNDTSGSGGRGLNNSSAGENGKNGIVKIAYAGSGSQATGGTITYDSGSNYTFHTFTSGGTFTLN